MIACEQEQNITLKKGSKWHLNPYKRQQLKKIFEEFCPETLIMDIGHDSGLRHNFAATAAMAHGGSPAKCIAPNSTTATLFCYNAL
jgi:hypothetical protein